MFKQVVARRESARDEDKVQQTRCGWGLVFLQLVAADVNVVVDFVVTGILSVAGERVVVFGFLRCWCKSSLVRENDTEGIFTSCDIAPLKLLETCRILLPRILSLLFQRKGASR